MKAKDMLTDKGWQYKSSCRCGGMQTEKYELQTRDGVFKLRVRSAHFLIAKPNKKLTKFPIIELENTIDEIYKKYTALI